MSHFVRLLFFYVIIFASISSCTPSSETDNTAEEEKEVVESSTIKGIVRAIEQGKDGYVAKVQTKNTTYNALVSIVNLGGPEHYKTFKVGDKVTLTGTLSDLNEEKHLKVEQIVEVKSPAAGLLISENSFRGITPGDVISKHSDYVEKSLLQTGEGDFEVYTIMGKNNNPTGYLIPDPNDENLVGDIVIETKIAKTADGIKVGSTFEELKKYSKVTEVHGSEIEGRTYATKGQLAYRLDVALFSYEVDAEKIPGDTKIIEIMIMRK